MISGCSITEITRIREAHLGHVKGNRITCALEIKSSQNIVKEKLAGLKSFVEDNPSVPAFVLGMRQNRRQLQNNITIINWDDFISEELSHLSLTP